MKAAVIYEQGGLPEYAVCPKPVVEGGDELLLSVKAAAIKHVDRSRASGSHYSASDHKGTGTIPGGDGVGRLPDGSRVYAVGNTGMLAEWAVIDKNRMVYLPEALDDITAAAMPNAVIGSAMALKFKADLQPGDTVLINGATGFTGMMAVQIAKHYGAGKIIATGRNEQALQSLLALGADEVISLKQDDEALLKELQSIHTRTPINVVVDYLWGNTAELILAALKGTGKFTQRTSFVSVGSVAGDIIRLSAANLRSANIQLSGSGLGSWTKAQVQLLFTDILPEMFRLAAEGTLKVSTRSIALEDIASLWNQEQADGTRLVVTI